MSKNGRNKPKLVEAYTISDLPNSKNGAVVVNVTSGALQGRKTTLITTKPSAAYFSVRNRALESA